MIEFGLLAEAILTTNDLHDLVVTVIYSVLGLLIFAAFIWVVIKATPFPVIKEIEQDQNVALAILMGSAMIGLAIIIASALHG